MSWGDARKVVRSSFFNASNKLTRPSLAARSITPSCSCDRQPALTRSLAAFLLVKQDQCGAGGLRQSNRFALAVIKLPKLCGRARYLSKLQPIWPARQPFLDLLRRFRRLQFSPNCTGNQNAFEESGKKILKFDENEVVDRRGVRDNGH
jgi:hypothetical protein